MARRSIGIGIVAAVVCTGALAASDKPKGKASALEREARAPRQDRHPGRMRCPLTVRSPAQNFHSAILAHKIDGPRVQSEACTGGLGPGGALRPGT